MGERTTIKETREQEEDCDAERKKMSAESSIFSTILADIEQSPTVLQKQKSLSAEFSTFTTTRAQIDEENPAIRQRKNQKLKKTRRGRSTKTPIDFARTVSQTLTRSDLVDILNQELKVLKSEMEDKGQTSDRFVSRSPNSDVECDRVREGKVEEQREEVKYLADEVLEWISRGDLKSDISTTGAEDSVCKPEDGDNNLENFDENEQLNNAEEGGGIGDIIEEMLEKIEKDGSYLERIKDDYEFGDFLEGLLRNKLREKADEEEKEISSWITDGEPEVETVVAEEKKEERRDTKKKSPVKVRLERSEQEPSVTKRDCSGYERRLYLIEKLRELDENLKKRRGKAVRCGVEFSFLVAEYMFLIPNELLASEVEDFWICLKRFGVNEDDMGTSVIIRKLEEVFEMVIRKKENKEYHNVDLPESVRFDDYIPLSVDAIQILGKIVWALRSNQSERLKVSYVDSLFDDFQKVLMKIELKLAVMKQGIYRSVSADYESFSKSERFDSFLRRKLMKRVNVDSRFGRSLIGSYLAEIWKSTFMAERHYKSRAELSWRNNGGPYLDNMDVNYVFEKQPVDPTSSGSFSVMVREIERILYRSPDCRENLTRQGYREWAKGSIEYVCVTPSILFAGNKDVLDMWLACCPRQGLIVGFQRDIAPMISKEAIKIGQEEGSFLVKADVEVIVEKSLNNFVRVNDFDSDGRLRRPMELHDCIICLEDMSNGQKKIMKLWCSHSFHRDCILSWLSRKLSCPTCRKSTTAETAQAKAR